MSPFPPDDTPPRAGMPRIVEATYAGGMHPSEYRAQLTRILSASSEVVAAKLVRFQEEATDGITIDVFVGQDGEGPFDVWARFEGADAFALDRRFDDERHLFGVVWSEDGWDPDVPARPRGWTWEELEAAIFDAVAAWLDPLVPARVGWELTSVDGTQDARPLGAAP